ncbi:hypothetical protein B0H21DRAFT_761656 [Amylocystis lapponica]|nr:hypothetical protein B0H21DRAFT_761656 [Amylocystis lapponica]
MMDIDCGGGVIYVSVFSFVSCCQFVYVNVVVSPADIHLGGPPQTACLFRGRGWRLAVFVAILVTAQGMFMRCDTSICLRKESWNCHWMQVSMLLV